MSDEDEEEEEEEDDVDEESKVSAVGGVEEDWVGLGLGFSCEGGE